MLERLVLKNPAQRTCQRVKWTSGARLTVTVDRSIARAVARSIFARSLGRSIARSLDRSIARSLGRSVARSIARPYNTHVCRVRGSHLTRNHEGKRFVLAPRGGLRFYFEGENFEQIWLAVFVGPCGRQQN